MSEEALRRAALSARFHARRAMGMAAGMGLAVGLSGAVGSILIYQATMPPIMIHGIDKGFNVATEGLAMSTATEEQQQARAIAVAATGAAMLSSARVAAKKL